MSNVSEQDDLIIEAGLAEILGRQTPPDLTARIMNALAQRQAAAGVPTGIPLPPPVAGDAMQAVEPPPVQIRRPVAASRNGHLHRRRRQSAWFLLLTVAAVIGLAAWGGWMMLQGRRPAADTLANQGQPDPRPEPNVVAPAVPIDRTPDVDVAPATAVAVEQNAPAAESAGHGFAATPDFSSDDQTGTEDAPAVAGVYVPEMSDGDVVALIDSVISRTWEEQKVVAADAATDEEWCRRTFLRLLGRIPTAAEVRGFAESRSPDKREKLVDQLLNDEAYAEEYARNWSGFWTNTLLGRAGGMSPDDSYSREGLQRYLWDAVQQNKPYDAMAFELLTATGSSHPEAPDFNGATNFLLAGIDDDATLATSQTSRVFLGQQVQCVQCHNHPTNDRKQDEFWEMNAFFRQMKARGRGADQQLVDQDFRGRSGEGENAEVYFEQLNGRVKAVYPVLPDGTEIPRSGNVADVNRREALATWLVRSPQFSRALVNRMWSHFFGFGFTKPVDDMGTHRDVSHPQLLTPLAEQLAAHGYDTKALMRWLALRRPFNLSSRMKAESIADAPYAGTQPLFSHYYTRELQPEEVYESLMLAARSPSSERLTDFATQFHARQSWLGQFMEEMGTDEGNEINTFHGDIRQSLEMMNGPLMQQATSNEEGSLLHQVVNSKMSQNEKIEHLFLAALSRKPSKKEMGAVNQLVAANKGNAAAAFQDIWWALLNSNEFILDH